MSSNQSKKCSKCLQSKNIVEYQKDSSQSSGLKSACKSCCNEAKRLAKKGYSPEHDMTKTVPDGFHVKGVSSLYDADGVLKAQWVKSVADKDNEIQALLTAMETLAEPYKGLAKPSKSPPVSDEDLLSVYAIGDAHVGMFSWHEETGNDHDLKIAEDDLSTAVDQLVSLSPPAKNGLILQLGDYFHGDSHKNQTTKGTPVDVDTRYTKILAVGIRIMKRLIDRAAQKHEHVTVINCIGNHDGQTSLLLSLCLANYYCNDPRVTINTSPSKFHWHRFGSNLIGVTHGDTVKMNDLPGIMACDRPVDWGSTTQRAWYVGHVHHQNVKEFPGVTVESFRTLAGSDNWHHSSGYRSGRDMVCDVWHRDFGKQLRHVVGIKKIRSLQGK